MVDELITATDLDAWSRSRQAQGHLPSLIRAAVMGTVAPESIRFPAAEGVGRPGFDGLVEVIGGAPPYVPDGLSVWEVGTGADPAGKAGTDYTKRTRQLAPEQRAHATFVFVTSRVWEHAEAWAQRKAGGGWRAVRALDADALALWLETLPGVRARFSEVLGRQPYGVTPLARWFQDWQEQTTPALPPDLLLAGRLPHARSLAAALTGAGEHDAGEHVIAGPSRDEATAFLAATLLAPTLDPASPVTPEDSAPHTPRDVTEEAGPPEPVKASREALAERTVVVHDERAWRRCVTYDQPMILVPVFADANVPAALRAGHHVVIARRARAGDDPLPPLDRLEARRAWQAYGLPFVDADELARGARRSLTSLRRRISRGSLSPPGWAVGAAASTLAPLLLGGAWRDDSDGDRQVVAELDGRSWRDVLRDLAPLRAGDDAPIAVRDHLWEFVDVVDAWEALIDTVSPDDFSAFARTAEMVLSEPDPGAELNADERQRLAFSLEGLPRRRFSGALRRAMADTLAVLGAVVGDRTLADGKTGQQHADRLVYRLLHDADAARWTALADLLPLLAEAAPAVFLDALERSLASEDPSVMALFHEQRDPWGLSSSSSHSALLWALERLAFSTQLLSRVAVVLARLAERDPGGRLANRPAATLRDLLHLLWPQSAATPDTRRDVLDRLRIACPATAWTLMLALLRGLDSGITLNRGPVRRDWVVPHRDSLDRRELTDSRNALAERLADDAGTDPHRWSELMGLLDRLPTAGRAHVLATAAARWEAIPDSGAQVATTLAARVTQHEQHPEARWALPAHDLKVLRDFLADHPPPDAPADRAGSLFSYRPRLDGRDLHKEPELLMQARQDALREVLAGGLPAVLTFAAATALPALVGAVLATISNDHDQAVLDLLAGPDPAAQELAAGLVRRRQQDDPGWLAAVVADRPGQVVSLLLHADPGSAVLDQVDTLAPEWQQEYWRAVPPWRFNDGVVERAAEKLLQHDRPYSAITALADATGSRPLPVALGVRALRAPSQGTAESVDVLGQSAVYLISTALDSLRDSGADLADLADLEWYYLPLLDDQRTPQALHARLAREPEFFADMVQLAYRSDTAVAARSAETDPNEQHAPAEIPPPTPAGDAEDVPPHVATAALSLLREWTAPLPGATAAGQVPAVDDLNRWVTQARAALAARDRAGAASLALAGALSGPATDTDGTWPCLPVRETLEREQDAVLEQELAIARFNQRGVTSRSPYSGGDQERELVAQYRRWADAVRDRWPRSGAVLDDLAHTYDLDARREDLSAARTSDS
jgi:hypothetical protein